MPDDSNRLIFRRTALLAVLYLAGWNAPARAATIIVVRHAERAGGTANDVPLSSAGEARADRLSQMLKDAGVRMIITSEVARTQQTAKPLAQRLGIPLTIVPARDMDGLAKRLGDLAESDVALVVGHSNTAPVLVERLSRQKVPPMNDAEFDRMMIVHTSPGKSASVLTIRY